MTSRLSESLSLVLERIDAACHRAGRARDEVRLLAVTKTFPAGVVREAMELGQTLFGENRVQEGLAKIEEVGPGATWHMIGHLQRNKARHAVGAFELIHGVDGEQLAAEIDRRATAAGSRQGVLVQVHLGGEETKHGASEEALWSLLARVAAMPGLDLRGLMTIPPPVATPEDNRRWFARMRELREEGSRRLGLPLTELSMGMTDDFEPAIEEGATLVRIGRAIFGSRLTKDQAET